ncbi:hypothetical protein [Enhygromyxa salina]|uniref:hypothetical protein n=1 Tax=Enhygromyxa salina TaxID=215803 RepID=UPI000D08E0BE|nr:hypothetical protein [Enhygromyxa salina]
MRPRCAHVTRAGVELLLVRPEGGWALVQCRRAGPRAEARTLAIDPSLAERAELVARAFEHALGRSGSAALGWLDAAPEALAQIERGEAQLGDLSGRELLELLDDGLDDPELLVELSARSDSPLVAAAVVQRLVAREQLSAALTVWERGSEAIVAAAEQTPSLLACATVMESLRGDGVAATALAERLGERASDPALHEAVAASWIALRDPSAAAVHLRARAQIEPSVGAWEYLMATAALARDPDLVVEAAARARALGADDRAAHVRAMIQSGAFEAAEATVREQLDAEPESSALQVELASLLLRRVALDEADALAKKALSSTPELADAHAVRGGVAVLRSEASAARAHLDRALELEPEHPQARLWRAEAILKSEPEADPSTDPHLRLGHLANEDLFGAPFDDTALWQILFALVRSRIDPALALHGPLAYFHRALLRDLHPPELHEPALATDAGTVELLWQTLARFGGSRSAPFSMLASEGDEPSAPDLILCEELASTQVQATRCQHRLLTTPVEQVLAGFEVLAERYPDSPHPHTYTAEIELWRGNYQRAWELTDAMWTRTGTRWSYIGSGAALGLLGRHEQALERWRIGRERFKTFLGHEATYCHRGEVYRLMGRLDEARADLLQATRASETRVGAWINLALVMLADTDGEDALAPVLDQIDGLAPVLVWEASRAAADTPAIRVDRRRPRPVLERALQLMRGNRSSVMHTFVDDRGRLRVTPDRHLEIWSRVAQRLRALPEHGLGSALLSDLIDANQARS